MIVISSSPLVPRIKAGSRPADDRHALDVVPTHPLHAGRVQAAFVIFRSGLDRKGASRSGTAAGSGGTVTLAGTNTFDGLTNLNGGTLIVTGSLAGGVTIANTGEHAERHRHYRRRDHGRKWHDHRSGRNRR